MEVQEGCIDQVSKGLYSRGRLCGIMEEVALSYRNHILQVVDLFYRSHFLVADPSYHNHTTQEEVDLSYHIRNLVALAYHSREDIALYNLGVVVLFCHTLDKVPSYHTDFMAICNKGLHMGPFYYLGRTREDLLLQGRGFLS